MDLTAFFLRVISYNIIFYILIKHIMPGGRPSDYNLDIKQLEELCHIHCTISEIESITRADEETVESFVMRHGYESFRAFYAKHSSEGKMSVRRRQYHKAMYGGDDGKGDSTMLKWLGKQWLHQRDLNSMDLGEGLRKIIICNAEDEPAEGND